MPRLFTVVLFAASAALFALLPAPQLTAQQKAAPPTVPAGYPTLTTPASLGAKPGASVELVLTGTNLANVTDVWTSFGGKATVPDKHSDAKKLTVKLDVPADAAPGLYALRVEAKSRRTFAAAAGASRRRPPQPKLGLVEADRLRSVGHERRADA